MHDVLTLPESRFSAIMFVGLSSPSGEGSLRTEPYMFFAAGVFMSFIDENISVEIVSLQNYNKLLIIGYCLIKEHLLFTIILTIMGLRQILFTPP